MGSDRSSGDRSIVISDSYTSASSGSACPWNTGTRVFTRVLAEEMCRGNGSRRLVGELVSVCRPARLIDGRGDGAGLGQLVERREHRRQLDTDLGGALERLVDVLAAPLTVRGCQRNEHITFGRAEPCRTSSISACSKGTKFYNI